MLGRHNNWSLAKEEAFFLLVLIVAVLVLAGVIVLVAS